MGRARENDNDFAEEELVSNRKDGSGGLTQSPPELAGRLAVARAVSMRAVAFSRAKLVGAWIVMTDLRGWG